MILNYRAPVTRRGGSHPTVVQLRRAALARRALLRVSRKALFRSSQSPMIADASREVRTMLMCAVLAFIWKRMKAFCLSEGGLRMS